MQMISRVTDVWLGTFEADHLAFQATAMDDTGH
jgi:hypothetical protein